MILTKQERLALFFAQLKAAPPASSFEEGYALLVKTLNDVENEFSGAPYQADYKNYKARMYAPLEDNICTFSNRKDLIGYFNKAHITIFGQNGAILITTPDYVTVYSIAGHDGKEIKL